MKAKLLCNYFFGALMLFSFEGQSQQYHFSQSQTTYQPLQNASTVSTNFSNAQFWAANYGFHINYFGRAYNFNGQDGLLISSDGYVASAEYTDSTDVSMNGLLADIKSRSSHSGIFGKIDGSSGNRIVKLEWRNVGFTNGPSTDSANFQIWLYESDGKIEFRYGPSSVSNASYGGLSGPSVGFYVFSLKASQIGQKLESYFLTGDPANPSISNFMGASSPRMNATPENGTVYTLKTSALSETEEALHKQLFSLYPNPAVNTLNFSTEVKAASIYDARGVETVSGIHGKSVPVDDLAPGIYWIKGTSINGADISARFVK